MRFSTRSFMFSFILAAVPGPIVGADFLARYHLAVDMADKQLFWPCNNMTLVMGYHLWPSVGNVHQLVSIAERKIPVIPASVPDGMAELL
jgi:hypothetical protein